MYCNVCGRPCDSVKFLDCGVVEHKCSNCGSLYRTYYRDYTRKSMSSYIHKCMHCNSMSYEIEEGKYMCGKCGFIWEVIDCGF